MNGLAKCCDQGDCERISESKQGSKRALRGLWEGSGRAMGGLSVLNIVCV